jgi:DNA invertase Pin-like site-specific DNA recombinase
MDQSIEVQRSDLRRYCEQRGFEIVNEYEDEEVSGTKDRRPALDDLMEDARKRLFDGLLCWRFDRFARSTKHLISALDEFRHLGIEFISYQENIDTIAYTDRHSTYSQNKQRRVILALVQSRVNTLLLNVGSVCSLRAVETLIPFSEGSHEATDLSFL